MAERDTSVLLVDDHEILRDGLRALLESEVGLRVVGEAGTGAEAIAQERALRPQVIVMDLGLPDMSGLEAIRQIRLVNQDCRIVVLSMHSRPEIVRQAIEAGADGYVPKSSAHTNLLEGIHVVLSGESYLHPKAATALVAAYTADLSEAAQFEALSEREQEVLQLTAMGFSSREIGQQLHLSPKTVETYRQRAMDKLGLQHRADLVQFAIRSGILDRLR